MTSYISLFSGIEAASAAWEPLGWEPMAFAEVEPFPCAVLAERWPGVENLGDVREIDWKGFADGRGRPDVVVGGSPCQSFSVAGGREGLDGESRLMYEYIRAVRDVRPRWFLWENVPGVFSIDAGRAFGILLDAMAELGYGYAWRVLDAQFFGVAQRRRRVFLVGRAGAMVGAAAAVLFDAQSVRGNTLTSREKRQELARAAGDGAQGEGGSLTPWDVQSKRVNSADRAGPTPQSGTGEGANIQPVVMQSAGFLGGNPPSSGGVGYSEELSPTLRASESGTNGAPDVVHALTKANGSNVGEGVSYTLDSTNANAVCYPIPENAINRPNGGTNGPMAYGPADPSPALRAPGAGTATPVAARPVTQYGEVAGTLRARADSSPCADSGQNVLAVAVGCRNSAASGEVSGTIQAKGSGGWSLNYVNPVMQPVPMRGDATPKAGGPGDPAFALRRGGDGGSHDEVVVYVGGVGWVVRRLTPVECERLQGFPDGWTDVPYRGRERPPDTPRYKAIGNSMAVPVMRWIGERMEMVDGLASGPMSEGGC